MVWKVVYSSQVASWLDVASTETYERTVVAIEYLSQHGPATQRPLVGIIKGSRFPNMKELRPVSSGTKAIRLLFAFDPKRKAVLLIAGDKMGRWEKWYQRTIPEADAFFEAYLRGEDI